MSSSNESKEAMPGRVGAVRDRAVSRTLSALTETFGMSRAAAVGVVLFAGAVIVAAVFWFVYSAPPHTVIITTGPPGSTFERSAERYRDILARSGVAVKILPSHGSMENLQRLGDPAFDVDVGFIQAGELRAEQGVNSWKQPADGTLERTQANTAIRSRPAALAALVDPENGGVMVDGEKLFSLGSVAYQPLLIFYRGSSPMELLSGLAGKRLAIGPKGSGTRALASILLATNGIAPGGPTTLLDLDAEGAAKALLEGNADAVFLMGDSASIQTMRTLLHAPGVRMFDFAQADAYARRYSYLNKLQLPRGAIDLGKDMPPRDVNLVGPTVELVARAGLHPALSDLLLEAAREVHGNPGLLQRRNEFPAPIEQDFRISPEAARYYKSGKGFLYRSLPFWLASLVNRVLVAFVPMALVLIPGLRFIPTAYKWRIQLRIYRWYRSLLRVERELFGEISGLKREELHRRLDQIESSVNRMKVPASFAGQFYGLREHIGFVRSRLDSPGPGPANG